MKPIVLKAIVPVILCAAISACKENKTVNTAPVAYTFKKEGDLQIFKAGTDSLVSKFDIEIADGDYETQTGLMHRASMASNQGMLFVFEDSRPRAFYMKNTLIPLDIIYIDSEQRIVSMQENAIPQDETSLPSRGPAMYVLEINGGLASTLGLKAGDSISFKRNP